MATNCISQPLGVLVKRERVIGGRKGLRGRRGEGVREGEVISDTVYSGPARVTSTVGLSFTKVINTDVPLFWWVQP